MQEAHAVEDSRSGSDTPPTAGSTSLDPSRLKRFLRAEEPGQKTALLAGLIGGMLAIFVLDLFLPQELAPEMLYALMVLGSLWLRRPPLTVGLAALSTVFILLADIPYVTGIVLVNHVLSIFLVWVIALLVIGLHGFLAEIQEQAAGLEQRVRERTADLSGAMLKVAFQAEQLRELASELTLVEQRERTTLAERIHNGLQQLLVAAKLRVSPLSRVQAPEVREACEEINQLLDDALADARALTAELSPPILRTGGLLAGLEWLARWSQDALHLTVRVQAPATALPPLPDDLTVLCFQSLRELLAALATSARLSAVQVALTLTAHHLTIRVTGAADGLDPGGVRGAGGARGGFALARIRHRLELLGGSLEIVGALGQQSCILLAAPLPAAAPPPVRPQPLSPSSSRPAEDPRAADQPRRIRVLIADDHLVVRQALMQMFHTEADIEVVGEADTGVAAVTLAAQMAPDVVLMDINMPEMNGIDATRAIHSAFPSVRVIGLSMFDRGDQEAAMRDAGAVAYLSKRTATEGLLAAIRAGGGSA